MCDSSPPTIWEHIIDKLPIVGKSYEEYTLSADGPQSVPLAGLSRADVVILQIDTGSLSVALTSANGVAQSVPVSTLLMLVTNGNPITALTLTRSTGVSTKVHVLLAQSA